MPQQAPVLEIVSLAQQIEHRINQRTWRRIRRLVVEVLGERIVIRGVAPSYYMKQLAVAAVQEVLRVRPQRLEDSPLGVEALLVLDIVVE